MLVALVIFIIIIGAVVSAFLFTSKTGRAFLSERQTIESSRQSIEELARQIRMGTSPEVAQAGCTSPVSTGYGECLIFSTTGSGSEFSPPRPTVRYYLEGTRVIRDYGLDTPKEAVTPEDVNAQKLSFFIPTVGGRVTLFMTLEKNGEVLNLQTTVALRNN